MTGPNTTCTCTKDKPCSMPDHAAMFAEMKLKNHARKVFYVLGGAVIWAAGSLPNDPNLDPTWVKEWRELADEMGPAFHILLDEDSQARSKRFAEAWSK